MKKLILTLLFLATITARAELTWLTDLDAAKAKGVKENKPLLVDFTGSDWCPPCIQLHKVVFESAEFAAVASKYVLVELDYPRKTPQAPELKAKNKALSEKFGIEGFPTILLLDANGEPFAQTGYQAGGPVKYLAHLAELMKDNTSVGKAKFAQGKKDEVVLRGYGEALEVLITPHLEKKDLAAAEAAIAKFIKDKAVTGAAKVTLSVNARVGSVQACKPGDHSAVLKVLDEIIADNPADLTGELKQFRAQVAAAQAADKDKK